MTRIILVMSLLLPGCTSTIRTEQPEASVTSPNSPENEAKAPQIDCTPWKFSQEPPYFLESAKIMITRVMKPCKAADGAYGFTKGSGWLAMGFPCTGGGGKISIKGKSYKPKKISFPITNSCPMIPEGLGGVKQIGEETFSEASFKPLAYYPFAVQYWELVDYREGDVGFEVGIWSAETIKEGWKQFRLGQPLRVRLYGREDAWVRGKNIYKVSGEIIKSASGFSLNIIGAEPLPEVELKEVIERCGQFRGQRACADALAI